MVNITRVLCPIDFSEFSRRALDHAAAVARWYEAPLTVLYVFANLPAVSLLPVELADGDRKGLTADDRERLMTAIRHFVGHLPPDVVLDLSVRDGANIQSEILCQADLLKSDLLVIGSHGRSGFERLILGSVTEKVMRKAPCPVMVVPRSAPDRAVDEPVRFHRILCPVDFSASSIGALTYAIDLAEEADAQLTVLHAIEVPPELREHHIAADFNVDEVRAAAEATCLQRLRQLIPGQARTYCTVESVVVEGSAGREILRQAAQRKSDLIVMGVRGRGAVDLMVFGSNTQHVVRSATCPVLSVPRS